MESRGSIWEIGGNRLGEFRFFPNILWYFWVFLGFIFFPKWLIKVPGHFGILFGWFRELRKFCQNLVPETSGLSQKCFNKYKKNYGIILEKSYFCQSGTSKNWKCSKSVCPRYQFCFRFRFYLFVRCVLDFLVFFWVYMLKVILRRWGIEKWYIFHY